MSFALELSVGFFSFPAECGSSHDLTGEECHSLVIDFNRIARPDLAVEPIWPPRGQAEWSQGIARADGKDIALFRGTLNCVYNGPIPNVVAFFAFVRQALGCSVYSHTLGAEFTLEALLRGLRSDPDTVSPVEDRLRELFRCLMPGGDGYASC